jgi:hypothetical protein
MSLNYLRVSAVVMSIMILFPPRWLSQGDVLGTAVDVSWSHGLRSSGSTIQYIRCDADKQVSGVPIIASAWANLRGGGVKFDPEGWRVLCVPHGRLPNRFKKKYPWVYDVQKFCYQVPVALTGKSCAFKVGLDRSRV